MFKELAGLGSLLKNAQQISGRMKGLADELRQKRATGSVGGGMVEVEVNGAAEVLHCRIEEKLVADGEREMIEELLVAATNQALQKAKQLHAEAMKELTGGISLPGMEDAMAKFLGPGGEAALDPEEAHSEEAHSEGAHSEGAHSEEARSEGARSEDEKK